MQTYRRLLLSSSLMGLAIAGLPSPATTVSPPPVVRPPAWALREEDIPSGPPDPTPSSGRAKYASDGRAKDALDRAEAKRRRRAAQRRAEHA